MASFSNPTEKWWERYWKVYVRAFNDEIGVIVNGSVDFYFLQFRRRNG